MDAVQVKLWVPDQKTLKDILSLGHFTLDCGAPSGLTVARTPNVLLSMRRRARSVSGTVTRMILPRATGEPPRWPPDPHPVR